ncbi:MAG: hypothetical protein P8I82_03065 [Flavobacteriales bacterium]|nr:hypothetical protein [Flavobacteriales bacterium]
MVFKKGDQIAFLNEPLKGVVVDYINDSHVLVECDGIEMDVSAQELIRISYIPKVDGKHKFPIKKEDRRIDDLPNLEKNPDAYTKLSVGDRVNFMSDNTRGNIVAIIDANNYEVEIDDGFSIPAHRLEIEKVWVEDFEVDEKALKSKIKKDVDKQIKQKSKSNQPSEKFFSHHEIDLHIENLIDAWQGMSNYEIVSTQLSCFRKRLFQALENHEEFLVVIHGVGKGTLKEQIDKYLLQFPNITVSPADPKLYGMGASEIRIS